MGLTASLKATAKPAQPGTVKARVLACHGALDPHVPLTDVTGFAEEMNHAQADWQLRQGRASRARARSGAGVAGYNLGKIAAASCSSAARDGGAPAGATATRR